MKYRMMVSGSELGCAGSGGCMGSVLMRRGTSDDAPEIEEEVNGPEDGVELELEKKDPMMRNIEGRVRFTHDTSPFGLHSIIYH